MALTFGERLKHAWNVFKSRDPTYEWHDIGVSSFYRPDRLRMRYGGEKTIINAIYNRIATDAAAIHIQHARLDENGRFVETIKSGLNNCLTVEANIDQSGRAFIQDAVLTMLDEGVIALVPVETTFSPDVTKSYDINTMRVGKIVEWYPKHVKVNLYNEETGQREDVLVPKKTAAIVENPFYAVMNDQNSTMQRLIRKLSLLDAIDEQSSSGKLNMIIQLPYTIKTDLQRRQAENRRTMVENQLSGSKYGIAYSDATEKIIQLNRPLENNLLSQIEFLTKTALAQLGMDESILNCTADEKTMLRYYDGIVEPIVAALCDNMERSFLTKTARTQNQAVIYYRDPFKLVPVSDLAAIANAFTRNEILTSNEVRSLIGMKPSTEPSADELRNKNLYPEDGEIAAEETVAELPEPGTEEWKSMVDSMNEEEYLEFIKNADEIDSMLDELESELDRPVSHGALGEFSYNPTDKTSKYNHEYYEAHKQLKGRKSTAGLNEAGKEQAWLTKERLNDERKEVVSAHKEYRDRNIEANNEERKQLVERNNEEKKQLLFDQQESTKTRIENIRNILKQMSPEIRKLEKDGIYEEIDRIREQNKKQKDAIREDYKGRNTKVREDTKSKNTAQREEHKQFSKDTKEKYDQMYLDELDKIKANPAFQKYKINKTNYKSKKSNSKHTYTYID